MNISRKWLTIASAYSVFLSDSETINKYSLRRFQSLTFASASTILARYSPTRLSPIFNDSATFLNSSGTVMRTSLACSVLILPWNLPSECSFSASLRTWSAFAPSSLTSGKEALSTTFFTPGNKIGINRSISRLLLTNLVKFSVTVTVWRNWSLEDDDIFKDLSKIGTKRDNAGSVTSATKVTEERFLIHSGTLLGLAKVSTIKSYLFCKSKLSNTLTNFLRTTKPRLESSGLKSVERSVRIGTDLIKVISRISAGTSSMSFSK